MDFYLLLVFIHVLGAAASIGPFFILLSIVNKLKTATGRELEAFLDTFWFVIRFSKHSGHVLVGSGVLLVIMGPLTWRTPWILATMGVMVGSIFFLARGFSSKLKKFREIGQNQPDLASDLKHSVWVYLILLSVMLMLMIVKPGLWLNF